MMNETGLSRDVVGSDPRPRLIGSQLIGVWTLLAFVNEQVGHVDVHPFGTTPRGVLIYTADGFVSAQLMKPDRHPFQSSDWNGGTMEEYQESASGYIAYCGRFEVNEEKGIVTHIPDVALLPNLIDRPLLRSASLLGDLLILRTTGAAVADGGVATSWLEWIRAGRAAQK